MTKERVSDYSITHDVPLTFYENSPELTDLNPKHVRVIQENVVSSQYFASTDLSADQNLTSDILEAVIDGAEYDPANDPSPATAPSLGDISVIQNKVVYDADGTPSVTVIFKIKNSSNGNLKGMNARVSILW